MIPVASPLRVSLPFEPLRPYISHYWLSIDNTDDNYSILPDGSVDLVVVVAGSTPLSPCQVKRRKNQASAPRGEPLAQYFNNGDTCKAGKSTRKEGSSFCADQCGW